VLHALSNENLIERVKKLNALNCNRLLGYLAGAYADQPVEHFWKAAAAALADYQSKSQAYLSQTFRTCGAFRR